MALYLIANGPMPTTAAQAAVTTGTAIKTLLQVKPLTGVMLKVVEWGISFDGSAAATPIKVELLETDVAATVTASVTADITKFDDPNSPAPETAGVSLGTAATGYTSSAEGTITAVRMFDVQFVAPTNQYVKQYPLGREPKINVSKFLRVRVTAGTAVNAFCYLIYEI
jgi:hypothetical protein